MKALRHAWNSLHARLLVGAAIWIMLALAASDIAIGALFRQHVTVQFEHELTDHMAELQATTRIAPDGSVTVYRMLSDPRFGAVGTGHYWQVSDLGGRALVRSPSLGDDFIRVTPNPSSLLIYRTRLERGGQPLLLAELESDIAGRTLRFAVGADEAQLEMVVDRFAQLLRLSLTVIAVGLMAAAAAQVALGLRPMSRLKRMLVEVRTGRTETLPDNFPNEVKPLITELNSLIEVNHERVRRARAQAGNLAHALKGPLAILNDEAQRLIDAGDREAGEVVLQQCATMSRQIDHQMARARAAATRAGTGVQSSPPEIVGTVLSAMARLYGDRQLVFENDLDPDLKVACDPDDFGEMIGNLIDNAAKWARSHVLIRSEPGPSADTVWIIVEDDGPGIEPEDRTSVFEVGARLDERKPGSGLGLAIVKDLAELYGGRVRLERSGLGGLSAALELPK